MRDGAGTIAVQVRAARAEDAAALANLATQLGYPSTTEEIAGRLRQLLPHGEHQVFVAEAPGEGVRGFLHAYAGISLESGPRAEILGLVTDATMRSRGMGRRLVTEAEGWARARGLAVINVHCNVVRDDAHRFYEGLGFACVKTQKYFRKPLAGSGESGAR